MNEYDIFRKYGNLDEDFKILDLDRSDIQELYEKSTNSAAKFKEKYFDFYDDVKSSSKKHEDW